MSVFPDPPSFSSVCPPPFLCLLPPLSPPAATAPPPCGSFRLSHRRPPPLLLGQATASPPAKAALRRTGSVPVAPLLAPVCPYLSCFHRPLRRRERRRRRSPATPSPTARCISVAPPLNDAWPPPSPARGCPSPPHAATGLLAAGAEPSTPVGSKGKCGAVAPLLPVQQCDYMRKCLHNLRVFTITGNLQLRLTKRLANFSRDRRQTGRHRSPSTPAMPPPSATSTSSPC